MSGSVVIANGNSLGLEDNQVSIARLLVQSDNNLVLYGTGSAGGARPMFSCFQHADNTPLLIYPELLDNTCVDFYGAHGDGAQAQTTASIASGGTTLTVGRSLFTSEDVGKNLMLPGAGASGGTLYTTIQSCAGPTEVTLGNAASAALATASVTIAYGHDDSAAFGTAHNAVAAAGGGAVHLGARTYLISQGVQVTGRIVWQGKGWSENGSQGSWILQGSPIVSPFSVSGSGAVGGGFRDIGFRQVQTPINDSNGYLLHDWTPIQYPPVIAINQTGGEYLIERIMLLGVYAGIVATGAGRVQLSAIRGEVFLVGIQMDQGFDCAGLHDIHFWPYWSGGAMNVLQWTQANADAVQLLRVDGAIFSGQTFGFGYRSVLRCSYGSGDGNSAFGGSANDFAIDYLYGDACKYPLWIDNAGSVTTNASGQIGKFYTTGETVQGLVTVAANAPSGTTSLVLQSSAGITPGAPITGPGIPTTVTVTVASISGNTITLSSPSIAAIPSGTSLTVGTMTIPGGSAIQVDGIAQLQISLAKVFFHAQSAVSLQNDAPSSISIGTLRANATNEANGNHAVLYASNPTPTPHVITLGTRPDVTVPYSPPLINAGSTVTGSFPGYEFEKIYPAPAGNYSFPNWVETLILEPAVGGTVSNFTVTLPTNPKQYHTADVVS